MFGIGEGELAIIVVFGFLLFGPDKLPQMGRTIGRAIRQFRETQEKMTAVVQSEIIDPVSEAASAPVKPKKTAVDDDSDADKDAAETAAPAKKETFAERVVAPCHNCHGGLEDIIKHYKLGMHTKFIGDLIYELMEKPEV